MEKILMGIGAVTLVLMVAAGIFFMLPDGHSQEVPAGDKDNAQLRSISVSGSSELSHAPEKVEVFFSVVTDSLKAADSQKKNAEVSAQVVSALQQAGFSRDSIETVSYSLQENREWEDFSRKYVLKGYKTINSLKVSSKNTGDAGKIIDAAIGAGANQIDSIAFSLTDDTVKELKLEALKKASEDTISKSSAIAGAVGVKVKQLETITENQTYYYPVYKSYAAPEASGIASDFSTQILEGQIKVSAQVSAVYSIE